MHEFCDNRPWESPKHRRLLAQLLPNGPFGALKICLQAVNTSLRLERLRTPGSCPANRPTRFLLLQCLSLSGFLSAKTLLVNDYRHLLSVRRI